MIVIGVTGGIGSGKSTVCNLFAEKQIPIFKADDEAKRIAENNFSAISQIKKEFGDDIYDSSAKLNSSKLAKIVFSNTAKLHTLNSIIHPLVFNKLDEWKKTLSQSTKYALAEAALFFESGMDAYVDYILGVVADENLRIERVVQRDKTDFENVQLRIKNQLHQDFIKSESDFVIENNEDLHTLSLKVDFFHTLFSTLKKREMEQ